MRAVLLLLALLLPTAPAIGQPLSKEECAVIATNEEQVSTILRKLVKATESTVEVVKSNPPKRLSGQIAESAIRANEARVKYLDAARAYLQASEDLAYQYRLCAR